MGSLIYLSENEVLVQNKKSGQEYYVKKPNPKNHKIVKKTDSAKKTDVSKIFVVSGNPLGDIQKKQLLTTIGLNVLEDQIDVKKSKVSVYSTKTGYFIEGTIVLNSRTEVSFERIVGVKSGVVENVFLKIKRKDKTKESGLGTKIFLNQVQNLKKLKYKKIITSAERASDLNGYYTWARLGYEPTQPNIKSLKARLMEELQDYDITDDEKYKRLREKLKAIKSMKEMMKDQGLREFWKEYGNTFDAKFELDNKNVAYIKAYAKAKGIE